MNKRKTPKSLQKPLPIVDSCVSSDNLVQFELELCWCVQQLEQSLDSGKLTQKVADETSRNIKSLKSSTVPLIRKRQLMKSIFGDYRSKMKEEEKKFSLASKQVKFMGNKDVQPKFNFVKKSAILTTGKDFRFNFDQKTEESQNGEVQTDQEPVTSNIPPKKLNLASGEEFKFNFTIDLEDDINLNSLTINSKK